MQCTAESSSSTCVTICPSQSVCNYTVKLVNPVRKSEYVIRRVRDIPKFMSVDDAKLKLCEELEIDIQELGYISPGHGLKGKLNPLTCDEDLKDMYVEYKNKRDIMLWCSPPFENRKSDSSSSKGQHRKKRSATSDKSDGDAQPQPKKQACAQKIRDVEAIDNTLTEKHGSAYTVEQMNAWAHMIHMGKHSSTEAPPTLPYFGKAQTKPVKDTREAEAQPTQPSSPPAGMSPG